MAKTTFFYKTLKTLARFSPRRVVYVSINLYMYEILRVYCHFGALQHFQRHLCAHATSRFTLHGPDQGEIEQQVLAQEKPGCEFWNVSPPKHSWKIPIKHHWKISIYSGCSIATFDYQRVDGMMASANFVILRLAWGVAVQAQTVCVLCCMVHWDNTSRRKCYKKIKSWEIMENWCYGVVDVKRRQHDQHSNA